MIITRGAATLSDKEIKAEARKRLEEMDPAERKKLEDSINEGFVLVEKAVNQGYKSLSKEERLQYHRFEANNYEKGNPGGYDLGSVEYDVMNKLNVTRDEIKDMKKNPFHAGILRYILLAALAGVGMLVTAWISKATGWDLDLAYPILGGAGGLLALGFGDQLVYAVRFRRLQRSYEKEGFDEKAIEAAVYNELRDQIRSQRGY